MIDNKLITFIAHLGDIYMKLRDVVIDLKNSHKFKDVKIYCDFENRPTDGMPMIYMDINAEIFKPINNNLHSLMLSFEYYIENDIWRFQSRIGWSSYDYGFEDIVTIEKEYDTTEALLIDLNTLRDDLITRYLFHIEEYLKTNK